MIAPVKSTTLILFFSVVLAGCGESSLELDGDISSSNNAEIVGGSNADITQYPWQVSIQSLSGVHFCGGSIVSPTWVLTAQHCLEGETSASIRVVAGITRRSQAASGQARSVAGIVRFPGYNARTLRHDVALIQLASPLDLSGTRARAIALATEADAASGLTQPGVLATVTGWGTLRANTSSIPNILQQVQIPLISNEAAQAAYRRETIFREQLAAGAPGKDSCQGDSGGPLAVRNAANEWRLAGVVSWGYGCGDARFPGIYARVSSYAKWVSDTVGIGVVVPGQQASFSGVEFTQASLSSTRGAWRDFSITVPEGASSLRIQMTGGSGDADLYVQAGRQPTLSRYDCRPFLEGNNETCNITSAGGKTYYFSVYAYASYANVNLIADYQ